jgi:hypothetical protein
MAPLKVSYLVLVLFWANFYRRRSPANQQRLMWFWLTKRPLAFALAIGSVVHGRCCLPASCIHPHLCPWTSHYYRYTFFYPALYLLHALGDPYLGKYNESPGLELTKAFWSFNTIWRTARSVVAKKRAKTRRKATPLETVEHGRWRLSRSSLDMPTAYLEMSIEDRLCITLFCQ